ncbi:DUF2786 domain-containing protein [Iamia majanohamensis]|uniref:DUF2786 domain-containing protein n=1 Tax=Iamia majanohamensis TaxID=467976 RepID=A0AAE9YHD2_9ACTN|nr:DUF2786 domain-containing protein [Iamia majanohamensis]WCO68522.1 DUF2786 domain-containing protein [Iamia majanohamensis]
MSRRRKQQHRRPAAPWRGRARPDHGARGEARPPFPPPGAGGAGSAAGPAGPGADRRRATSILALLAAGRSPGRRAVRDALGALDPDAVQDAARPLLEGAVAGAWAHGWQPSELAWHVGRVGTAAGGELLVAAVRADAARLTAADLDPRWADQLAALGVEVDDEAGPADPRWLAEAWAGLADPAGAVGGAVAALGALPPLQVLLPVPGRPDVAVEAVAGPAGTEGIDAKVLERVRALLAKAEATTFEAEAQAFTAKAHELMTRHSVEHAVVAGAGAGRRSRPVARRLRLDDPYADAKALLVQVVAEASRCRAVQHTGVQMSTVVGFESDIAAVEVLFTSLLVQAQTALQELAGQTEAGSRERTRGFRSSFLTGFAHRIGQRLDATGEAAVAEVDRDRGGALLPVLAERAAEVDDELAQLFPRVRTKRGSGPADGLGYRAGTAAAERADLPWAQVRG